MSASLRAMSGRLDAPQPAAQPAPLRVTVMIRSMGRPTLQRALASVARQTHDHIDVLVVNARGGSHPALGTHCGRFPLLLSNQDGPPLGRPVAANHALDAARGDALMFLDDDDEIDAGHVQRLCEALQGPPPAEVAYAGVRLVDGQGQAQGELDAPFDSLRLWMGNFLPIHAPLFLRRMLDSGLRFDESMPVYEDWDFWLQLSRRTRFVHVPGVSASYHLVGDSGLTYDPDTQKTASGRLQIYRKWLGQIEPATLEQLATLADAQRARQGAAQRDIAQLNEALQAARQAGLLSDERVSQLAQQLDLTRAHVQMAEQSVQAAHARELHLAGQLESSQRRTLLLQEEFRASTALQAGLHEARKAEVDSLRAQIQALQAQLAEHQAAAAALQLQVGEARAQHVASTQEAALQIESAQAAAAQWAGREIELLHQAQRAQAALDAQREAYGRLEMGYGQVTNSLSWRITRPLRLVRSLFQPGSLHAKARRLARGTMLALPIPNSLKDSVKLHLATRDAAWARGVLRLLAHPMAQQPANRPISAAPASRAEPAVPVVQDKEAVRAMAEAELTDFLASGQRVRLGSASGQPRVSVIVVLFNQAGLSLRCLQALAASQQADYEVIVVDNRSTDRVPEMLSRVDGARLIRHDDNLGFLRAVNDAAAHASGEFLLLLNNDAEVFPDTLARAVQRLQTTPAAGAVGGPIYLWDGKLQEAGSIVWNDGSCLGYGRGDHPAAPAYRFLRDVDYCSGALLLIRRALFEQLGRFDEVFAPAYYEESDFCVRLWEAGHSVVYDPQVRVRHFEFASQTASTQALELQARNQKVFRARHLPFLGQQREPSLAHVWRARARLAPGARRVLFIDDRVPFPWIGQGFPRACDFVHSLVEAGHLVTHYPLQFPDEDWSEVYRALPERVEVMLGSGLAGLPQFLQARQGSWDLMIVSRPHNMQVVSRLREQHPDWFEGLPIAYDAEALFTLREVAKAALRGTPIDEAQQRQMLDQEMALSAGSDCVIAVSDREARHYLSFGRKTVHVLGHAISPRPADAGFEDRQGFLFVGTMTAEDTPNTDSVLWFLAEVWPLITAMLGPAAQLDLVGACHSAEIRALATPQVRIHGQVDDVGPWYARARVLVVPTRYAAGIPHKAHEGASRGLPMVCTSLIAGQLEWSDEVLIADDPAGFARHCVNLHGHREAWVIKRQALLQAIERDCSPAQFSRRVSQIVESAVIEAESR